MAGTNDVIRIILMSLPAIVDGSKELMQNFRKAKINDEDVQAALNDLLDQRKEIEELKTSIEALKKQGRTYFLISSLLLAVLIVLVIVTL